MIAQISGLVASKDGDHIVILIGGIGLEMTATRTALEKSMIGESVLLYTRLIVREDLLALFAFSYESERDIFDELIKVSGVGPKLAIAILSTLSLDNLRSAVASERADLLTRVPGIGKKTAQKIVLDLKDKLPTGLSALPGDEFEDINSEVMDALISLGFSVIEAQTALQSLPASAPPDIQERIRLALQQLSS